MATEPKTEAKQEAKTEAKQVVIEENTEAPLKYKTWVLKVSVHCEGCKKKVKKILNNIDGVYTADVDLRQQKATVIGNIDADTLIKKLIKKTGKNAELWPEKADNNRKGKKKGKAKNKEKEKEKEKQSDQESSDEEGGVGESEKEVTVKTEVVKIQDPSPKKSENGSGGHVVIGKATEGGVAPVKAVKISEASAKQPVTSPAGGQSPVAGKKVGGESEVVAEKSGAGGGSAGGGSGSGSKKKKKKKGNKGNNNSNSNDDEGNHSGQAPAGTGSPNHGHVQVQIPHPANQSPPRYHHVCDYPARTYYAPPVYAASSNVAYPSPSYGASCYAPQHSYAYMHAGTHPYPYPGGVSEPPPSDFDSYPSQPSDSFEIFSDENPNACSIM